MGGVMSCCFLGLILLPALYGGVFVAFGLSGPGMAAIAAPALLCAVFFALPERTAKSADAHAISEDTRTRTGA